MRLAKQPIRREEQHHARRLLVEAVAKRGKARAVDLGAADAEVEEYALNRHENPFLFRVFEDSTYLIGNGVLKAGAVPRIQGADREGLFARKSAVVFGNDLLDFLPGSPL